MKKCPKCKTKHNKDGVFCSRSCANSRVFSEESKLKKSLALLGKKKNLSPESKIRWMKSLSETWNKKYEKSTFDELGKENKKRRVLEEQKGKCNHCGLSKWRGEKISLELEHKDGNNTNYERNNLECLCPNCHSLTNTWRGRNKPYKNGKNRVSNEILLKCLTETGSIRQGLLLAGLAAKGNNYKRAKKLLTSRNG